MTWKSQLLFQTQILTLSLHINRIITWVLLEFHLPETDPYTGTQLTYIYDFLTFWAPHRRLCWVYLKIVIFSSVFTFIDKSIPVTPCLIKRKMPPTLPLTFLSYPPHLFLFKKGEVTWSLYLWSFLLPKESPNFNFRCVGWWHSH